jgi:phospholipid transport system transporter-binding protein
VSLADTSAGAVEIVDLRSGQVEVRGALTFATAKHARAAGRRLIEVGGNSPLEMDCSGVTESDSAGLAVLLDWLALAKRHGRRITFKALPAPIRAVAELSSVTKFLESTSYDDPGAAPVGSV